MKAIKKALMLTLMGYALKRLTEKSDKLKSKDMSLKKTYDSLADMSINRLKSLAKTKWDELVIGADRRLKNNQPNV